MMKQTGRGGADAAAGGVPREVPEETGVDPTQIHVVSPDPAYIEYGRVPARPEKDEPSHHHLDIGYTFATARAEVGCIQESEATGANWYPVEHAERLVGHRISRAISLPARTG